MSKNIINGNFFFEENDVEKWFSAHDYMGTYNEVLPAVLFSKSIFVNETFYEVNEKRNEIIIVFNPKDGKTFYVEKANYEEFKTKYFQNLNIIQREPSFFVFIIPIPFLSYSFTNGDYPPYDDHKKMIISKFKNTSYENVNDSNYTMRLSFQLGIDSIFGDNDSDPIFQSSFQDIYEISMEYKKYLAEFLCVNKSLIKINKLIRPYYKLEKAEIDKFSNWIDEDMMDYFHEEARNSELRNADIHEKKFNDELDELNWQMFENDSNNYWNID